MIKRLKNMLHELARDKPGERFINFYRRRQESLKNQNPLKSYAFIGAGVMLLILGILLSIPPGSPGFLLWVPALGMIAAQVRFVARFLDRFETISLTIYGNIKQKLSR
jgi:sulfite exporter TauE/SafE